MMAPTSRRAPVLCSLALALAAPAAAAEVQVTPLTEHVHAGTGHDAHVSAAAVGAGPDGAVLLTWAAQAGHAAHVWLLRAGAPEARPVQVSPPDLGVEALHHSPLVAAGPGQLVYVSWSSAKPKPPGTLFASDLRLSRSPDGGRTWEAPLRVNEDRPLSHSFDGLAVAPDGTVLVAWIDNRAGVANPESWLARVVEQGTRVAETVRVDADTCVCCRIGLAVDGGGAVAVLRRKVYAGDVRDMALSLSRDGGRRFAAAARVHDDGWQISGCPHRGGQAAFDGRGRVHAVWYTEGRDGRPTMRFATSADGRAFGPPRRLDASAGSVPDHVRLAADRAGALVVVWEDATAVRRRILLRASRDGGRSFGPVQVLSRAIKAHSPDVEALPGGGFAVAWHEERFPSLVTVVRKVTVK
jgi:hypothetical protein